MADVVKAEWRQAFELSLSDAQAERALADSAVLNIFRGSILVRTMIILEAAGASTGSDEQDALREMRNAICHNQFDLSRNRNSSSVTLVAKYHQQLRNGGVSSANPMPLKTFFSLTGSQIGFSRGPVHETCRQLLMKYI